jgi:hypothetical protein
MAFAAKNHLSEVIGLKNDIVHKVFSCPNCKTEVTISRYQVEGQLSIMCARCNMRYQIKGEELSDLSLVKNFGGFEVFGKGEAAQFVAPVPKDSYLQFVKDGMKWKAAAPAPKPAVAAAVPAAAGTAPGAPAAPKPAPAAGAAAPEPPAAPKPPEGSAPAA